MEYQAIMEAGPSCVTQHSVLDVLPEHITYMPHQVAIHGGLGIPGASKLRCFAWRSCSFRARSLKLGTSTFQSRAVHLSCSAGAEAAWAFAEIVCLMPLVAAMQDSMLLMTTQMHQSF